MIGSFRAIVFCSIIAFGGILFGYDIVIAGCLIMPDFISRFGELGSDQQYFLSPARQSEITSLLSAGTFFGALAQAFIADRIGRKYSVFFWSSVFTVGSVIQTASDRSIVQLMVGRFVAGLGVGALSAIVPLYSGEAAPRHLRGSLLSLYQVMIIFGLFVSYLVTWGTHVIPGSASWRVPVGFQIALGVFLCVAILYIPESPRHLLNHDKVDEARAAVASLNSTTPDSELTSAIMKELTEGIAMENDGGRSTWAECFSPKLRRRVGIGMMLMVFQQFCGQNFYYYYGDTFFKSSGTPLSPYAIQAILGGVSWLMVFPSLYLIEVLGRRRSLLYGAAGQCVCAFIAALVGRFTLAPVGTPLDQLTSVEVTGGKVLIASAIIQVSIFSLSWGPTCWVYLGESFPLRVRAKSIALGAATNWFWNCLLGLFAPRIAASKGVGPLVLLIFAVALVLAFLYVLFFVPETKGLSLEQVDEYYNSGVSPFRSAAWKPTLGAERRGAFQMTVYKLGEEVSTNLDYPSEKKERDQYIEHVK